MRIKKTIVAAIVLSVVLVLAFSATALAYNIAPADGGAALTTDIAPHDGYGNGSGVGPNGGPMTDFCIQCHDVHEAQGDYVLTRKATVTATCGTCHGLFGASATPGLTPDWSPNQPTAGMAGTPPTTSDLIAYNVNMSGMTTGTPPVGDGTQMDAVPGHSLGVMYGGTIARADNSIPGSTSTLKVMISGEYGGIQNANHSDYAGDPATSYSGTQGLYCASCHSPHGSTASGGLGNVIQDGGQGANAILSSRPNHSTTVVTDYANGSFCLACHDKRNGPDSTLTTTDASGHTVGADNLGNPIHNHPSEWCLTCHGDETGGGGTQDFPHTSSHKRLLTQEPDALCLGCHTAGHLP